MADIFERIQIDKSDYRRGSVIRRWKDNGDGTWSPEGGEGGSGGLSKQDTADALATAPQSEPAAGSNTAYLKQIAEGAVGTGDPAIQSIQTSATGATWVSFASAPGHLLRIENSNDVAIEYRRGGAGTAMSIQPWMYREVDLEANANEISVRRVDQSNTQITIYAEVSR